MKTVTLGIMWPCRVNAMLILRHFLGYILLCFSIRQSTAHDSFSSVAEFQNIDFLNQSIYVGATNFIYRLDSSLKELARTTTGPKIDNPDCIEISTCNLPGKSTDNVNKILTVYAKGQFLIACGTLFQGFCETKNLSSLKTIKEVRHRFVAAKYANASTVAFISQSYDTRDRMQDALFVGATRFKSIQLFPKRFVAVASFSLKEDSLFKIIDFISNELAFQIENLNYLVDYIFGFADARYSFLSTVQRVSLDSDIYHSKLLRVCKKDARFGSYTEMPLSCKKGNIDYNILISAATTTVSGKAARIVKVNDNDEVLIGLFAQSKGPGKTLTNSYGICVYSLNNINQGFNKIIDKCLTSGGLMQKGLPWSTNGKGTCVTGQPDYCGKNRDYPIGGSDPLKSPVCMSYSKEELTSINAFVHPRGLTIFLGTADGSVLKFTADDKANLTEYGKDVIEAGKPVKKILFAPGKSDLLAMGKNKLVKIPIADCTNRKTCDECLSGPGCGWCTLERKCSVKTGCIGADKTLRFIDISHLLCPRIVDIKPSSLSVVSSKTVTLIAEHLPPLSGSEQYICSFNGAKSTANVTGNSVICPVPGASKIPRMDKSKFSNKVTVSLQASMTHLDFISTSVVLYNCSTQSSCLPCTQGLYVCDWCSTTLQCVDSYVDKCSGNGLIKHAASGASVITSQCPRVLSTAQSFIAHGVQRQLEIVGKNLPAPTGPHQYTCVLNVQNKNFTSPVVSHNASKLVCAKSKYTFTGNMASVDAQVSVLFGGRHLDSPDDFKVTLYRCDYKREDCSICLRAPITWHCGWCLSTGICTVSDTCQTKWINSSCPAPHINEFYPKSGSVRGGTVLIITGRDLGTTFHDIQNVTVAGTECKLNETLYVPSKQVACHTVSVHVEVDGKVVVFVKTSHNHPLLQGVSKENFSFRIPKVLNFSPLLGPCSGGTELTISGEHLNIGRVVSALVSGKPCKIVRRMSTAMVCITSISSNCQRRKRRAIPSDSVVVSFDGHSVPSSSNQTFQYKQDPIVTRYNTRSKSPPLRTFASGGQVFIVEGERFTVIQKPKIVFYVYKKRVSKIGPCIISTDTLMNCLAPNVSNVVGNVNYTIANLGFIMDNVQSLRSMGNITVVRDPVFTDFDGEDKTRELRTRDLILEGQNLDVLHKTDVRVTVGGLKCEVTSLDERLVCTVPEEKDLSEAIPKGSSPAVMVYIGDGDLIYNVGYIKFYNPVQEKIPLLLYIGPAAAGVFVLIIIIIILVILYRRRNKKEREYHKVYQMQMDNLESRYARECKEAFAELQTEITDLTTDLSTSYVPYLDFETYAMRILFPGIDQHPVMEKECNKSDAWKKGMLSLCRLIQEKDFLLCFVRTLEGQSSFSMRDRCKVASLLMVTLQDDIGYCTSVLRDLLSDLIEKSVESGRTKLLLRRTESVAEKLLTNWLAYNLHGFVESRVGETLFRLFAAIGALLDKEPVDAVTHEARNSLSEDKLLRQKVDFKPLNVKVEYEHDESVHVQLLNIDTIGQTKQKALNIIYKNLPFSQRPNKDTLELGWILPTGGVKIMADEDETNEIEGEWKRVNTLEHFRVQDGALLRLSPCGTNYSIVSGSPLFHDTTLPSVLFHPNNSSTPMLNHNASEQGSRLWHLVKVTDYPVETRDDARHSKMMAEVYLTRLLKTKGTLQNFVDDLFDAIFKVSCKGTTIPPAVKYIFDFLDKQATFMGIEDNEVIHTWKNNSLPLRFWINIIKNPNFIFDVFKSNTVDSCLSVIGQLFMDSCSPDEHRLGKDSPSNKLLYAKDIPKYKQRVARFYSEVRSMASVNDNELSQTFMEISKKYGRTFNQLNAANELLGYAVKYKVKVMDALEFADMESYADRLQEIMETLPDD